MRTPKITIVNYRLSALCLVVLVCMTSMSAGVNPKNRGTLGKPGETVSFARRALQGFNMRVWLSNKMTMGIQAWDVQTGAQMPYEPHLGLEYPLGQPIEHLYGAGPWFGGKVDGIIHVDEGYNGDDARNELLPEVRHLVHEHFWHTFVGASASGMYD